MNSKKGCLATALLLIIGALVAYSALLNYASAKRAELFEHALNASVGASEQMLALARARLTPETAPATEAIKRDLNALRNGESFASDLESESTTPVYDLLRARPEEPSPSWICKDRSTWGPEAETWADRFQAAATPYIEPFLDANAALPSGVEAIQLAELLQTNLELYVANKDYAGADEILVPYAKLLLRLKHQFAPNNIERMEIDGWAISILPIFARFVIAFGIDNPSKANTIVDLLGEFDEMRVQISAGMADEHLRNLIYIKDWEELSLDSAISRDGVLGGARNWLWVNACGPLFTNDAETYVRLAERAQEFKQSDFYVHGEELAELMREVENLSELYPVSKSANIGLHKLLYANYIDADLRMLCVAAKVAVYRRHEGKFPTDLAALMGAKANRFVDPFTGEPFRLITYGDSESFLLESAGRDGMPDTDDDNHYGWQLDGCAEWPHPMPKKYANSIIQ